MQFKGLKVNLVKLLQKLCENSQMLTPKLYEECLNHERVSALKIVSK